MLQLAATLKAKAAWGHLAASLAGCKTSDLWHLLENLFNKMSEVGEERSPPPKRSHSEDQSSTSGLGLSVFTSTSNVQQPVSIKSTVIFLINKGSLHDSGIKPEYLPVHEELPHNKSQISLWFPVWLLGPE